MCSQPGVLVCVGCLLLQQAAGRQPRWDLGLLLSVPGSCLSAKRSTSSDGVMSHCSRFDAAAPPRCSLFVLLNLIVIIYFQVACKFAAAAAGGDSVSLTSIC